ncbi:polyprenyl diphosphate synthase [Glutamicibacter endophyticus]|uniref:isoprenyl transferase n=1 Tax=Glutamicibacter sp. PS TaxID=3075634 RepID=UPI0028412B86|nr:isoprenyl transferase [Glutamicibacter sp. PS]MDR4533670.1 isoprenyl transferase [Glutamicibacter sp. PS]
MRLPSLVYRYYERRVAKSLSTERLPHHIGVMVDGNRRWAKLAGSPTKAGHQAGADKILEFLGWCDELGIKLVTLYMLSTDNLNREADELRDLLDIIGNTLDRLGETNRVKVQQVGARDLLPAELATKLAHLEAATAQRSGIHVNVAIGYGGRREIIDAVKALLHDAAQQGRALEEISADLDVDDVEAYLYTKGQPDPDLVIRTSGEQRLSGFLTWQSAYSEFYFCEALWPDFRRVDFLRALRDFADRQRRFGA